MFSFNNEVIFFLLGLCEFWLACDDSLLDSLRWREMDYEVFEHGCRTAKLPGFISFLINITINNNVSFRRRKQGHIWKNTDLPILEFWVFFSFFCGYIPRKYINIYKYKHKYIFLDLYFPLFCFHSCSLNPGSESAAV